MSSLSPADKKSLEEIHRLFLRLEASSQDGAFDKASLTSLINLLGALKNSADSKVSRLAEIQKHLEPGMSLKHFSAFAVPFERLLKKNLQDDDFLIVENDRATPAAEKLPLVFVLDNIRSAFNVGSIFRTAECLGAEKIYLCGYTPLPDQLKVEKTAMGTQVLLPWQEVPKIQTCLDDLRAQGYHLVALETAATALDLYSDFLAGPTALILGNERFGLDAELVQAVHEVRQIPLRGQKNSLNVGVTAAVAGFEWMRQWRLKQ